MKRIADFTLGQYRRSASPADLAAFDAAFQNYAVAVYQSYFAKYAGQTLKVTGSQARAPDDFIVATALIDPNDHSGQPPLEVDFRVRTDTGKPVVIGFLGRGHLAGDRRARPVHLIPGPEWRQYRDAEHPPERPGETVQVTRTRYLCEFSGRPAWRGKTTSI